MAVLMIIGRWITAKGGELILNIGAVGGYAVILKRDVSLRKRWFEWDL